MSDLGRNQGIFLSVTVDRIQPALARDLGLRLWPRGSLLLPKSGASVNLEHRGLLAQDSYVVSHLAVVSPAPVLDSEYLYAWSQTVRMTDIGGDPAYPSVKAGAIAALSIPLPPLSEQRCIVEILRNAETVRRHQTEAASIAAELIPALFRQMFGPQAPHQVRLLKNISEVVSGVAKGRSLNTSSVREIPYLRVANVQDGHLDFTEVKTVPATEDEITELKLQAGDVVMTEGGDEDKLGRGAMWRGEIAECIHQNHIFRVRPAKGVLDGLWFSWFLRTETARSFFLRAAKRTTNLASISISQLKVLPVPMPPYEKQLQFRTLVEELEHTPSLNDSSQLIAELHAALLARAFKGSLTARWREQNAALLATETAARDAALAAKGIKTATGAAAARPDDEDQASIYATPTDGAWADLTARQRTLWRYIPTRGAFGVSDLLHSRDKERLLETLSEDGFRRELEVFVARGALIQVSRPDMAAKYERDVFRHYYRRVRYPVREPEPGDDSIGTIEAHTAPALRALVEHLRNRLTS